MIVSGGRGVGDPEKFPEVIQPLADVLERFFVDVLVMCDNEAVRGNRIAMLKQLGTKFFELADLSKLQVEGGEE